MRKNEQQRKNNVKNDKYRKMREKKVMKNREKEGKNNEQ